jgi:hypothetical protein
VCDKHSVDAWFGASEIGTWPKTDTKAAWRCDVQLVKRHASQQPVLQRVGNLDEDRDFGQMEHGASRRQRPDDKELKQQQVEIRHVSVVVDSLRGISHVAHVEVKCVAILKVEGKKARNDRPAVDVAAEGQMPQSQSRFGSLCADSSRLSLTWLLRVHRDDPTGSAHALNDLSLVDGLQCGSRLLASELPNNVTLLPTVSNHHERQRWFIRGVLHGVDLLDETELKLCREPRRVDQHVKRRPVVDVRAVVSNISSVTRSSRRLCTPHEQQLDLGPGRLSAAHQHLAARQASCAIVVVPNICV